MESDSKNNDIRKAERSQRDIPLGTFAVGDILDRDNECSLVNENLSCERITFFKTRRKNKKIQKLQAYIKIRNDRWAFFITDSKKRTEYITGELDQQTSYRMELISLIELLEWLHEIKTETEKSVTIITESLYIKNCIGEWINRWKTNNFKLEDGQDRPNADLLIKIDKLREHINLEFELLKGENEISLKLINLLNTSIIS